MYAAFFFGLCCVLRISQAAESPSVKILVIGRTGSGKSTLINNILGQQVADVGHRPFPETRNVRVYHKNIHGVNVTTCDTPGLGDASGKEEDYLKEIEMSCRNPDLVVFCLSMDNSRWHNDDNLAIKMVTNQLGKAIWDHAVLTLTFADKFLANIPQNKQIEALTERIDDFKNLFAQTLTQEGMAWARNPNRLYTAVSAKGVMHLPGIPYWLTELMITCLTQTRESGKMGFRQILLGRAREPNEYDNNKPDHEQPIVLTETLCNVMKLNPGVWSGAILASKAGTYITTKLLSAKIGAVLGGPVGFLIGGVMGYGVETLLSYTVCSYTSVKEKDEL